ncbi:nitrogenase component 1 [uncultured Desulfobacter sp.]|uniref:nitrogenase component 1 n=1 Tax=uncultured Desulfobacter sp. TaxID=240139 RepID=UPI002AAC39E2|nr:nitrogenase component 1 [uncultured Desulfobacter sp.]
MSPNRPRKETPSYTPTQNACKLCTPLGATLVFQGIEGCVPLLHGSQGCSTYMRRYLISHFKEPVDIASSNFTEETAVFGGGANLKLAIENVARQYAPSMIGIATTCLSETIGDDVQLILNSMDNNIKGTALVHVSTPSYTGTHVDGFHGAVAAVVDRFNPVGKRVVYRPKKKKKINLFPGMLSNEDIRHLKTIFDDFHTPVTILPDYSERLEGPSWQEYQAIQKGGTPISAIEKMNVSIHSMELGSVLAQTAEKGAKTAGSILSKRFGIPCTHLPIPIGVKATDRFLETLSQISGKPVPERYRKEKWRLVDAYVDGNKYVSKKRALIYGEEDFVVSMAGFLAEVGIIPVLCASGGKSGAFKRALEDILPETLIDKVIIQDDMDFTCMEETAAAMPEDQRPEIIIGNSKGYAMARRLNIPLVRVGFPIHDRVGGSRILHIGYKGAQQLFDNIVNTILTTTQTESKIGYSYM